jgi:sorbitol/mannitol transport system permease protein
MKKTVSPFIRVFVFIVALIYFFPVFWLILTGFKFEVDAVNPSLFFQPTLSHYELIFSREIGHYLLNSIIITTSATLMAMVLGVPASYGIVMLSRLKKGGDNLFLWFISTILLPPICVVIPIFLVLKTLNILDNIWVLIFIYAAINTPVAVWMMRSFFKDIPIELIEASRIDGASESSTFFKVVFPLVRNGLSSTILLLIIFIWNEFFFAITLTYHDASTIPVHIASYMRQEGLFWAKMCAISTIAILPPMIVGWLNQKQLISGLTMGAIKG